MPVLKITTNQALDQEQESEILQGLAQASASALGKSEGAMMVILDLNPNLWFRGSRDPAALVELRSLGLGETGHEDLASEMFGAVASHLNVPQERVYMEFGSPLRSMFAYDGKLFA